MKAILMTEEYWRSTHLSVARFYGAVQVDGKRYIVVNKEGKDLYECSREADEAGREKAIEPGEPADLIDARFQTFYRALGREAFIEILQNNSNAGEKELMGVYKAAARNKSVAQRCAGK